MRVSLGWAAAAAGLMLAACASPKDGKPATVVSVGAGASAAVWPGPTLHRQRPLVIAHRGASGLRPEHTLAAYQIAVEQGADCIEPDLVMSKDGVLIDRHDVFLSTTTDVADHPEFASRKRPPLAGFTKQDDWFVADFTLAELKTLRARQLFPGRSKAFDGKFQILTFDELLDFVKSSRPGLCIYSEAKDPVYHERLGFDMAGAILKSLRRVGMDKAGSPVFIQSFEPAFTKKIRPMTKLPLVQLVENQAALDAARALPGAPFWDAVGAYRPMLYKADGSSSGLVEQAHKEGSLVHTWTYRDDARFKPGQPIEEAEKADFALGVDGMFTDFPGTLYSVRKQIESAGGK